MSWREVCEKRSRLVAGILSDPAFRDKAEELGLSKSARQARKFLNKRGAVYRALNAAK